MFKGTNPAFKGKELAVVGGGDSACEEAIYLTKYGTKVYTIYNNIYSFLQLIIIYTFFNNL